MFEIIFLGTSGGTPTIERNLPSIAIKYKNRLYLWDCGEGTQRQLMKYRVGYGSIDGIFITHPHLDHYLGLFGLIETLKLSKTQRPLSIFAPKNLTVPDYPFIKSTQISSGKLLKEPEFSISSYPIKHVKNSYGFVFSESDRIKFHEDKAHGLGLAGSMFREIQKKGKLKVGSETIMLRDVSWLKKGRKIVYSGDARPDSKTILQAKNADLLIHEATFDSSLKAEAIERCHSTALEAAEVAKKAGVKKLILTHISPRYTDPAILLEEARSVFPQTEIAYDGLRIEII